jgi:hypothetical protein
MLFGPTPVGAAHPALESGDGADRANPLANIVGERLSYRRPNRKNDTAPL